MKPKTHFRNQIFSFIILAFVLTFPSSIQALDSINQVLLDHAKTYPRKAATDLAVFVPQLISVASSDAEKAEVIFYWISQNIVYEVEGYQRGEYVGTIAEVIEQGKGVCHNYSELYQAMCQLAGLECHYIVGYAKAYDYETQKAFKETNHAWNIVKVNNEYLFVDATWGSGYVSPKSGRLKFYKNFSIEEVLEKPGRFSAEHLPGNPLWQLLEHPISLKAFQAYDTFDEMQAHASPVAISYRDSLNNFLTLEPHWQKVITADKTYRFNPTEENAWWLGNAYYVYGYNLSVGDYEEERLRKALSSYGAAVACFKTVKRRYYAAQKEIRSINKNIAYVRYRLKIGT